MSLRRPLPEPDGRDTAGEDRNAIDRVELRGRTKTAEGSFPPGWVCVCVWVKTMSSIITQIRFSRHNLRDAATRLGRGVTGNGRTCGKNTKSADLLHRTCVRGAGEREGEGERAAGWAGVGGGKRMLESRPTHSRITPESLPTHSRITPESFPNHSRLTPDSLPTHSQLTPVIFHKIGDLGVCAC